VSISSLQLRVRLNQLHHKSVARCVAAVAGLASAISILVGFVAARAAPHGWYRLSVALHLKQAPLIVKVAPIIAGVAFLIGAAAGIVSFYSWCRDSRDSAASSLSPHEPPH
jgi:hypothetical protein